MQESGKNLSGKKCLFSDVRAEIKLDLSSENKFRKF